jgi:hypothetical protein
VEAAEALEGDTVGEMPMGVVRMPLPTFAVSCPTRDITGSIAAMALYAGESVGAVTGVVPAGDVVRELAEGAESLLRTSAERPDAEAVRRRAHLLPEEKRAGSDEPEAEAEAILEESEHRQSDRSGTAAEHRRAADVIDPPD